MSTEEVLQALTRYTKETNDSERQTATKLGVNCMTLSTWLHGKEPPKKCTLARLAGFLRRVGYLCSTWCYEPFLGLAGVFFEYRQKNCTCPHFPRSPAP